VGLANRQKRGYLKVPNQPDRSSVRPQTLKGEHLLSSFVPRKKKYTHKIPIAYPNQTTSHHHQNQPKRKTMNSETILDIIHEQTSNIERSSNLQSIKVHLKEALKEQARSERDVREKTVTFSLMKAHSAEVISDKVLAYALLAQMGPISFRTSKEFLFAQLSTPTEKEALVDYIRLSDNNSVLKETLLPPVQGGRLHFQRLPVKLELNNLASNIKLDRIKSTLESLFDQSRGSKLIMMKDGKTNPQGKRTVSLKVNSQAFSDIFETMNGIIPFADGKIKTNLFFRINCRPWQCRDCFNIGPHPTCPGKACAKCGNSEHQSNGCSRKTRFCRNCNKPGHSARDAHCPRYLNELSKEIRKHDFPLEFLQNSDRANQLIKAIQLK